MDCEDSIETQIHHHPKVHYIASGRWVILSKNLPFTAKKKVGENVKIEVRKAAFVTHMRVNLNFLEVKAGLEVQQSTPLMSPFGRALVGDKLTEW